MATREQLIEGIRRADKAGDAESVRALGAALKAMDTPQPAPRGNFPATVTAMKGLAQGLGGAVDLAFMVPRKALAAAAGGIDNLAGGKTLAGDYARLMNDGISGTFERVIPTPANQRGVRAVFEGVGGAALPAGAANLALRGGAAAGRLLPALAANPVSQAVAGGMAGGAVEAVRRAGGGPGMQLAAGVGAGLAAPGSLETTFARSAVPLAARLRGAAPGAVDIVAGAAQAGGGRFTDRGVREAAARTLRESATDPTTAAMLLERARPQVSGARPTVAEVARDPGLAGLQRSLGNLANVGLKTRMDNNMLARQEALLRAGGDGNPEALRPALEAERAAAKARASQLYNFDGQDELVQIGPVGLDELPPSGFDPERAAFERQAREGVRPVAVPRVRGLYSLAAERGVNVNGQLAADLRAVGVTPRTNPGLFRKSGGLSSADELVTPAREAGFIRWDDAGAADTFGANDLFDALVSDMRAAGRGGAGARVTVPEQQAAAQAAQERARNAEMWQREFDARGLDPATMTAEDWDGLYRSVSGAAPLEITQADLGRRVAAADKAESAIPLSDFQASLVALQGQYFPGGVGLNGNVAALLDRLRVADALPVREVVNLGKALRRQSGALRASDGASASLAGSAANALEGLLSAQAGPALARDVRAARAGWRDFKRTFDEGAAGRVLASNRFGSDVRRMSDGAQVAQAVAANDKGKAIRELVKAAGNNQQARAAMRRAIAEYIVPDGATANVTASGDMVQSNLKTLQRLDRALSKTDTTNIWTTEQRKVLRALREELKGAQFAASAERPAGSNTSRDLMTQSRIARRVLETATAGKATMLMQIMDMFDRADDVTRLAAEAMLDPKLAAELLKTPTPDRLARVTADLRTRGIGATAGAAATQSPTTR